MTSTASTKDEYGSALRSVTLALGDPTRAEEVTQEAFVRALRRWSTVGKMANPGGWVVVVAINAERRRWRREASPARAEPLLTIADHGAAVATAVDLREALDRLTNRQRAAVVLRYLVDLPIADISSALGCAEGTVKATLHQALGVLRVDLNGSEP